MKKTHIPNNTRMNRPFRLAVAGVLALCLSLTSVVSALDQMPASIQPPVSKYVHTKFANFDPLTELPTIPATFQSDSSPYMLVQLKGQVTEEAKKRLQSRGIEYVQYIPQNSFIARVSKRGRKALENDSLVRWAGPLHPAFRVDGDLLARYLGGNRLDVTKTLIIEGMPGVDVHQLAKEVAGTEFRTWGEQQIIDSGSFFVDLPVQELPRIASIPGIAWVQEKPEYTVLNNQINWVIQSPTRDHRPIWDQGLRGQGQVMGILDSGLDYGHCMFRDDKVAQPGPNHRKVVSYRAYGGDLYDFCFMGHGTHVSGTAAGSDLTGTVATHNGVAPEAKIAFGDIQNIDNQLFCALGLLQIEASPIAAFLDAYNDGAFVHSNSWGSPENKYDAFASAVDGWVWQNPEFLPVFANGNSGPGARTVGSPATSKNVISVGAAQSFPRQANVADFSSRGPTLDNRFKPTLCMSGDMITSAKNQEGFTITSTCRVTNIIDLGFFQAPISGTSMACPAIAGAAVLTRQYFTDGFYPSGSANPADGFSPTAALIRGVMIASAQPMGSGNRPGNDQGFGLVVLDESLYFAGDQRKLWISEEDPGLKNGEWATFELNIKNAGEPLHVVLTWTDPKASTNASEALVNNLDLVVTSPSGTIYTGNVFAGGWSTDGGTADIWNNEEAVFLQAAEAGTWTITVAGTNVPQGHRGYQPYSLVATGDINTVPEGNLPPQPVAKVRLADTANDGGGSVNIGWDASADDGAGENDVVSYSVWRREATGSLAQVGSVGAGVTSYTDNTTTDRVDYFYVVRTVDRYGQFSDSTEAGPVQSIAQFASAGVWLAGYMGTDVSGAAGGPVTMLAVPEQGGSVEGLNLLYQGAPTGLTLRDDGLMGDAAAGDGVMQWGFDIPASAPTLSLMFALEPVVSGGTASSQWWPYLNVE